MGINERVLNERQAEFVRNFLQPESPTYGKVRESALRAGYSKGYASFMTCPSHSASKKVRELIDNHLAVRGEVTVNEIVEGIKKETTAPKSRDRLKAWELLGKYKKMFTEKVEQDTNININVVNYAESDDTVQLYSEAIPVAAITGDGRRLQEGNSSLAPQVGEGQDGDKPDGEEESGEGR